MKPKATEKSSLAVGRELFNTINFSIEDNDSDMSSASPTLSPSTAPIRDFYKDATILITGGTGFIGKVLIQKLLRTFELRKIYLLIRVKNNMSIEERLEHFFQETVTNWSEHLHFPLTFFPIAFRFSMQCARKTRCFFKKCIQYAQIMVPMTWISHRMTENYFAMK